MDAGPVQHTPPSHFPESRVRARNAAGGGGGKRLFLFRLRV